LRRRRGGQGDVDGFFGQTFIQLSRFDGDFFGIQRGSKLRRGGSAISTDDFLLLGCRIFDGLEIRVRGDFTAFTEIGDARIL